MTTRYKSCTLTCPHCGAPIYNLNNHRCEYCRSFIEIRHEEEIDPRYMRNVRANMLFDPATLSWVVHFVGDYARIYEPFKLENNGVITIRKEDSEVKKVGFSIMIPEDKLEYLSDLKTVILMSLPFEPTEEFIRALGKCIPR